MARRAGGRAGRAWGVALGLVAVLLALSSPSPRAVDAVLAAPEPQTLTPVRVGMQYITSDAGVFLADDRGFFREVGIELQGMRLDNVDLQSALASGQVEAGGIGPTAAVINAYLRGVRLKIVGDRGTLAPGHGYVALAVRKDLVDSGQVRTMADLRGRKIALQPPLYGTPGWYLFSRLLESGGLTEDDIEYVPLGFADQVAGLGGRTVDAFFGGEPGPTSAAESGLAVWFKGGDEAWPNFDIGALAYAESFAAQTDLARRFMIAYVRGVRVYLDAFTKNIGKDAVVSVLTRNTALTDPAVYDRMRVPYMNPDGAFNTDGYTDVQQYFIRHGVQSQFVDMAQMVDNSFANYAAQQLGPYR